MSRNHYKQDGLAKDDFLCQLEMRQTQSDLAVERLEIQQRILETTLRRFKTLYEKSPVGFITFDHAGKIVDINMAAARLLEVNPASVLGLSMTVLIAGKSCTRFMEHLRRSRHAHGQAITTEIEMIGGKNGRVQVQVVTSAIFVGEERIFESAIIDLTAQKAAAEEIARAREYAENIISTIPYPVMVLDNRACVLSANAAFYSLFQTSEAQTVRWPISELPDIDWRTPGLEGTLVQAINDGRAINDTLVRAENRIGSALTLNMNVRRLNSQPGTASRGYLLVAFEDITRRQRAEDEREVLLTELQESQTRLEVRVQERTHELGQSYGKLRDLGEQLILAHESEQRRIARELHDQIGQDLTALKITLNRGKNADPTEALRTLQEAEALTEELLQTVRNICGTLRPQVLDDLGLVHGLQWHVKTFSTRTGMDISVDLQPVDEKRLSPIAKSTIFRVIQEALTNVSRHAETKTAAVTLAANNGSVDFSIHDDGKGFDVEEVVKKSSTGLSSMRERLSLVQGRFEISSAPGDGTTIRAQIPLPPASKNLDTQRTTPTQERNRTDHGKITSD